MALSLTHLLIICIQTKEVSLVLNWHVHFEEFSALEFKYKKLVVKSSERTDFEPHHREISYPRAMKFIFLRNEFR